MKIKLHNDGKEKSFSFEASIDDACVGTVFGDSKESAIEALKQDVNSLIKKLQNIDYNDILEVDYAGNPLEDVNANNKNS